MPFDFNMMQRQQRGYHLGHKNITGLNHWKTRDPKFSTKSCQSCFHLPRRFSLWVSCVEYSWSPLECNWQGVLQRCHAKHIAVPRAYIGWKGRGAQGRWAWEVKRIIYSFVFCLILKISLAFARKPWVLGLPTVFQSFILGRIDYVGQQSLMKHPLFEKFLNSFGTHPHYILYIIRHYSKD